MKEKIICSDSNILKLIKSDSESDNSEGLNCLYSICNKTILKFITGNNGTADDAKDVIQDALIVFYEQVKNDNLELNCSISTYIYSVSRNIWLKKIKFKGKFVNDLTEFISIDDNLTDGLDNEFRDKEFLKMFNELGESCKEILLFYYYDNLSMKEIMDRMNFKSEQTAKNKKYKCLNYLRYIISKNNNFKDHIRNK